LAVRTFPVALKLEGRRVGVIGGGDEAAARAEALAAVGAKVVVVAGMPSAAVAALSERGAIELVRRGPEAEDLKGAWLLVLAERNPVLADELAREAETRRLFFCALDDPRVGSYSHLAIARAGLIYAAIGSQGEAPALSRRLREILDIAFERAGLAAFAERLATLRRSTPSEERKTVLDERVKELRLEGKLVVPEGDTPS
jgi:uroporphyrin-III C-methyltransferase/precorrin-2 dehydrogenase/sirohydrochlorin ferrochelatase